MTIFLYGLVLPDRRTNGTCQPKAQPFSLPICQWMARQLVRSLTHRRVPTQQPHSLCDAIISIPTRHGTNPPYGLQAETKPLRPEDGQRIHEEDGVCHQGSQVHDLQSTEEHDKVLQSKKVSGPRIWTRRLGIPRCVRYQNDMFISKVVTSQTGTLWNWTPSRTISLPTQVAPRNETVVPSVQRSKAVCCSRQSDTRKEATSPATTHCCQ